MKIKARWLMAGHCMHRRVRIVIRYPRRRVAGAGASQARRHGRLRSDARRLSQEMAAALHGRRLQASATEGAWFTNCRYPYAYTLTAPGHTSLSTGTTPSAHGIIANDWYDRASGESVTSVTPPPAEKTKGAGPYRRKVESVGDVLFASLDGQGARRFGVDQGPGRDPHGRHASADLLLVQHHDRQLRHLGILSPRSASLGQ